MIDSQPKGLPGILITDFLYNVAFYIFTSIFVIYLMTNVANGGLGWSYGDSFYLMGVTMTVCNLSYILGGFIGNLTNKKTLTIFIGLAICALGFMCLPFISGKITIYIVALIIAVGGGINRPNLLAAIGDLHDYEVQISDVEIDEHRINFSRIRSFKMQLISYNLGSVIGNLLGGYLKDAMGFKITLIAGGIVSILTLLNFVWVGSKFLIKIENNLTDDNDQGHDGAITIGRREIKKCALYSFLTMIVLLASTVGSLKYNLLNVYIEHNIDRVFFGWTVPTAWFLSISSLMMIVISLSSVYLEVLWKSIRLSISNKLALGSLALSINFVIMLILSRKIHDNSDYMGSVALVMLFNIFFAISVTIYYPILAYVATKILPRKFTSLMMSIRGASVGLGSYSGGLVSIAAYKHADLTFTLLIIFGVMLSASYYMTGKKLLHLV